ncbi:GNAT family N-acetyltransferase [Dyella sp.]|uniref:GNAT family N-acetyltransferase n=1 Tax=Dyella sp. TaxID=1869338 RepID=UPI002ECFFCC9
MGMTVVVRLAHSRDLPALRELFLEARRRTFHWQAAHTFQRDDFDKQTKGERVWVTLEGETKLVGFIALWGPEHFIHHLYVDAAHVRRGIGITLLRALPGWPGTSYRLKCLCRNEAALSFYRACGFNAIGHGTAEDGHYLLLEHAGKNGA